jgi:hypothetical protein
MNEDALVAPGKQNVGAHPHSNPYAPRIISVPWSPVLHLKSGKGMVLALVAINGLHDCVHSSRTQINIAAIDMSSTYHGRKSNQAP